MTRVAVLYPGELGSVLAARLIAGGAQVVTELDGRSPGTRRKAAGIPGLQVAENLPDALAGADLVLSLVTPAAAVTLAERCAAAMPGRLPLFVDANSVAPSSVRRVAEIVGNCVDAALIGPAKAVGKDATLLLSGPRADEVAVLLEGAVATRVVGPDVGQASALKMALALFTKAIAGLGFEAFSAAGRTGQTEHLAELLAEHYPETRAFLDRNLPTYATHAARRRDELGETLQWLAELGEAGLMTAAARDVIGRVADADQLAAGNAGTFIDIVQRQRLLKR